MKLSYVEQIEMIDMMKELRNFCRDHDLPETDHGLKWIILCAMHEMMGDKDPALCAYRDATNNLDPDKILESAREFGELAASIVRERTN